jgi:hypothetical protein
LGFRSKRVHEFKYHVLEGPWCQLSMFVAEFRAESRVQMQRVSGVYGLNQRGQIIAVSGSSVRWALTYTSVR